MYEAAGKISFYGLHLPTKSGVALTAEDVRVLEDLAAQSVPGSLLFRQWARENVDTILHAATKA